MQLGIFARTFPRSTVEETFEAVKSAGLDCVQFNFSCVGLPTLPGAVEPALTRRIRTELQKRSLSMAAVSGTCNLIHPDPAQRDANLPQLQWLIGMCNELGTSIVTLCTGSRDAEDMWRAHPDNDTDDAWRDLTTSLESLLPLAERQNVILGIEPEPGNVISSAEKARRLLDELQSPSLKIILDAANLIHPQGLINQRQVLQQAFDLLALDIALAHAKDLAPLDNVARSTGSAWPSPHPHPAVERNVCAQVSLSTVAAGQGNLDYLLFLSLLQQAGSGGPIILHSLTEAEAPAAAAFLKASLKRIPPPEPPADQMNIN